MRILHFSNKPAFPRVDGGAIAISELLKSLTTQSTVYHVSLSTHKHPFNRKEYGELLHQLDGIEAWDIQTELSITDAFLALIQNKSYNVSRFYSADIVAKLEGIISQFQPEIVLLESIFLLPYLAVFKKHQLRVIVRSHNIEHHIWEQQAATARGPKKYYLQLLSRQLKTFEMDALSKVDGILAISDDDLIFFRKHLPSVPSNLIPTPFEATSNHIDNNSNVFFLGAFDWLPNKEGVDWFKQTVLPLLPETFQLHLAGKSIDCKSWSHPQICCYGEVPSSIEFIHEHGICIIPLLSGSGVKMKLIENMAQGKAIVTTSEGIRGVDVLDNQEVMIANTPTEFANAILMLQASDTLRNQLGDAARNYVRANFGFSSITSKLFECLENK
jgi:glycosyltransferase involved in cell wall biosynthesis